MRIDVSSHPDAGPRAGEPWGARLWLGLAAVVLITAVLQSYGIASWPMADDEVPSLVELGLLDVGADMFSVPPDQVGRLPRTLPVWYGTQRFLIDLLPAGDVSYRIPALVCGVLTAALAFLVAARWRGIWFAAALALVLDASQLFVYVSQLNRFYAMPLLLLVVTLIVIWLPRGGAAMLALTGALTAATVLSHNITVAAFGLAFAAAVPIHLLGGLPVRVVLRTGTACLTSLLLYVGYVRPLVAGWNSTGNPTPVFVSFAAHAGIPSLALALLGSWFVLRRPRDDGALAWWLLVFAGSLVMFPIAPVSWNPRYFLFFLPAMWVLAAHGVERVARQLGSPLNGVVWYGVVALLLLPGLASHLQDGSRHDYRRAAAVVVEHAGLAQPVLSDDAETISYYLPADVRRRLHVRTKVPMSELPATEFLLVARANAWMPQPRFPRRRVELVAEIGRRRYDQFSHILRVYRVGPLEGS